MRKIYSLTSSVSYNLVESKTKSDEVETLIFIHGLGLDQTSWKFILPLFPNFRLLTYDFRWHGDSTGEYSKTDEENWKALFQDLLQIIKLEEIRNYHLITHGIGAQFAIEMISRDILSPITFTILSTPCYYPGNVAEQGLKFRAEKIKGISGNDLGKWMSKQILHSNDPAKTELIVNAFNKVNMDLYMDLLYLHSRAVSLEKLSKVTIPTLLLTGEYDVNYPPSLTTISTNYLQDCRTKIISNASNMVHVDQPEETANFIKKFIQDVKHPLERMEKDLDLPYLDLFYQHSIKSSNLSIRINFLTVFKMYKNGREIEGKWNQRKAKELMAYIAFHGKAAKAKIFEALWSESNQVNAQNSLRVSINHLRALLKESGIDDLILTDSQYVWLNPVYQVTCDVKEAWEGKIELPLLDSLFSDLPRDWVLELQYEFEAR